MLRDYQNESRPPASESYRQASPRQYQQVSNSNHHDFEDERPAYYR